MELISKNITPCSAIIPPPPSLTKSNHIASTAVFDKTLTWKPGMVGEIKISFSDQGAWSCMGTQRPCSNDPQNMNFEFCDPPLDTFTQDGYTFDKNLFINEDRNYCNNQGMCSYDGQTLPTTGGTYVCKNGIACNTNYDPGAVIIHEFGHALGMYHEHQNYLDGNPIVYDIDGATLFSLSQSNGANDSCVQDYCAKMCYEPGVKPIFCNPNRGCEPNVYIDSYCQSKLDKARASANNNVLNRYECTSTNCPYEGSSYDNKSVMLYQVDDYMIKPNADGERINPTDSNFSYSNTDKEWLSLTYPKDVVNPPKLKIEFLDGMDWQKYWVKKVVMEKLSPCVGIDFEFNLPVLEESIYPTECDYNTDTVLPTNPTTGGDSGNSGDNVNGGGTVKTPPTDGVKWWVWVLIVFFVLAFIVVALAMFLG